MNALNTLAKRGKINEHASVKDEHVIIVNASVDSVWDVLIDIAKWPLWNSAVRNVRFTENVKEGLVFSWNLSGMNIISEIQLIDPMHTLSCTGRSKWVKSIFLWQLEYADENQTIVTLSASMQGVFAILFKSHQKVYNDLISWLENLKKEVED